MEVKPGYKQTEMGVIPKDWAVKRLGELASVTAGGTPSRANTKYWNGDIPWITTSEVGFRNIDHAQQSITKEGLNNSATKLLPPGTLLMALYGQGKTRGKVGVLGIEAATNQACAAISLHRGLSGDFVFHFLGSQYEAIRNLSNTGNQENLNSSLVRSISIILPPKAEQKAIAEALSDTDALIESVEQLVAKKRQLKQGAVRELLTGKKRLPGFSGEWELMRMEEVLKLRYGKSQRGIVDNEGAYPIIATGGVVGRTNDCIYDKPSVVLGRKGTIDTPQYVDTPFWAIDTTYYTEIFSRAHPRFLYYLFSTMNWYSYNEASGVPSLSAPTLHNIELVIPSLPEQTAIAAILSDMDAEITALETKLVKTRQLKQGMMHELLTGRIRLV